MAEVKIHPTAIVSPGAILGAGTSVGPFSVIEEGAVLGERCRILEHVIIRGHTILGNDVAVHPYAVLGGDPQHTQYKGEVTTLEVGDRATIRECVTMNRGTPFGGGKTVIGPDTFIMAYTHIAHDCFIGRNVIIANAVQLAGHVQVHEYAFIGGQSAMPQFTRVGKYAYIAGGSIPRKDVAPFITGKGTDFVVQGVNTIGLTRQGFSKEAILAIRRVFKIFFKQGLTVVQATEKAKSSFEHIPEIVTFLDFIQSSKCGLAR